MPYVNIVMKGGKRILPARAAAASSGSHLSPLAKSFSLLYMSSSLVSMAYSAFGARCSCQQLWHCDRDLEDVHSTMASTGQLS